MNGFVLLFVGLVFALPAQAYIGPGLGVAAIWGALGPVAGIISLVLLIAYFPLRYLYKKRKHEKKIASEAADKATGQGEE